MILGTEQAAALERAAKLNDCLADLAICQKRLREIGRPEDAVALNKVITAVTTDAHDTQAVIDAYKRQERGRDETRALRRQEQLLLRPEAQVL